MSKEGRGRAKEVTKRRESKEVASIEKAYNNKRNNLSNYKVGDFVLLLQNDTENPQGWQGPHMIREVHERELYKIIDASDHSLIQTAKGITIRIKQSDLKSANSSNKIGVYVSHGSLPLRLAQDVRLHNWQLKATLEPSLHKAQNFTYK
ncbi:hypothetical protein Tco_0201171 [Tanacetum coccineum]